MHIREWKDDEAQHNGLRRPKKLYNVIKESYRGLKDPDLGSLTSKLNRQARSVLELEKSRKVREEKK